MPNLENLRKQAKRYLRWHRDGHYPVAVQIRTVLPRYGALTDRQVLASRFKLSDAQELVARKLGFEDWEALCKGVPTLTDPNHANATSVAVLSAEPQVFVSDMAAALAFYAGKLGFSVVFTYGSPPYYGQVVRGGARLNLRCIAPPFIDPDRQAREELLCATVTLGDAPALFREYQAAGVGFARSLGTEPWGTRTFIVRDPDGNLIYFAGPGPGAPAA